jgi:hypothetical protein
MPISEIAIDIWESLNNFLRIYGKPRKIKLSDFINPSIDMIHALGVIDDNYVLGGANFSNSTTDHRITVPKDERWIPNICTVNRDVESTLFVKIYNKDDINIGMYGYDVAATGQIFLPEIVAQGSCNIGNNNDKLIMKEGDYFKFQFGVAQTGSAFIALRILKIPFNPKDDYY